MRIHFLHSQASSACGLLTGFGNSPVEDFDLLGHTAHFTACISLSCDKAKGAFKAHTMHKMVIRPMRAHAIYPNRCHQLGKMKETIERIQDWYKINCNGAWEHRYGYKIETLDNPGWAIKIDLAETALENLEFHRAFQNPKKKNDWFQIRTENKILNIYCGPENMKSTFEIFFDELIPKYSDKNFEYEVYLPINGYDIEVWIPAKSKIINERSVQITEIKNIDCRKIKVRDVEKMNFNPSEIEISKINYSVGDILEIELEQVYNEIILTTKNKKEN